jgi:pimeloyl-ACP methyl ester carboxylesterase
MRENIAPMETECGDTVVTTMLGGTPASLPERYRQVSVTTMVPLAVPQVLIWGERENYVPVALARRHVEAAASTGDQARLIVIPRVGHFETASPRSAAWPTVLSEIQSLLGGPTK